MKKPYILRVHRYQGRTVYYGGLEPLAAMTTISLYKNLFHHYKIPHIDQIEVETIGTYENWETYIINLHCYVKGTYEMLATCIECVERERLAILHSGRKQQVVNMYNYKSYASITHLAETTGVPATKIRDRIRRFKAAGLTNIDKAMDRCHMYEDKVYPIYLKDYTGTLVD